MQIVKTIAARAIADDSMKFENFNLLEIIDTDKLQQE
jgi:hypothetical protein